MWKIIHFVIVSLLCIELSGQMGLAERRYILAVRATCNWETKDAKQDS